MHSNGLAGRIGAGLEHPHDLSGELQKYVGKKVSYATHGIHRYPAKFIPQIPKFCIDSYSRQGDCVLDPFMGSGTTLLECFISGRNSYGIDIHPLARLIAKVKTTPLDPGALHEQADSLVDAIRSDDGGNEDWVPEIPNRDHWFRPKVLKDLATIKKNIWDLPDGDVQDFFKICFSSIIRKVSNSDNDSLIPEVTSFQKRLDAQGKTSYDSIGRFESTLRNKLPDAAALWKIYQEVRNGLKSTPRMEIIGKDARDIELPDGSIDLAVTSPPYASAVHYVSVHKLEMFWLGMIKETGELDAKTVGTARVYAREYRDWAPKAEFKELSEVLGELMVKDKKSAYVVHRYFEDMRKNLVEVNRVLKVGGRYCMVVGENTFMRVRVPTYKILAVMAQRCGFRLEGVFVYDVINRHLDIPRWNDSRIEKDHILVLRSLGRSERGAGRS